MDGTVIAQKALSAIYRTGERFGVTYLVQVLQGKAESRITQNGHDRLNVFGLGTDLDATQWRGVFRQLLARGYIAADAEGHQTLQLTSQARPLLRGEEAFELRKTVTEPARPARTRYRRSSEAVAVSTENRTLFDALKALRLELARRAGVPPYVICHDRTLVELAEVRPSDKAGLEGIIGLGKAKIGRYGDAMLEVIAAG